MEQNVLKCGKLEEIRDTLTCAICCELYENARILQCSHTYCLNCLRELCERTNPTDNITCPQCRWPSIPPLTELDALPLHTFANDLADIVREQDGLYTDCDDGGCDEDLYSGDPILPDHNQEVQKPKRSKGNRMARVMLKSVATVATLGIFFGVQAAKKKRRRQKLRSSSLSEGFTCGYCNKLQQYSKSEVRYKCGMCEDFDLCQICAALPEAHVHRLDHILIKLKFRQKRQLPPGCLLKYREARSMSEETDFSTSEHGRAYFHTPEKIKWTEAISCSECGQAPIHGTRFKCGMCEDYDLCSKCEEESDKIHDKDHVFLVFKNRVKVNIVSKPLMKALVY